MEEKSQEKSETLENGLSDILPGGYGNIPQINKTDTMQLNSGYGMVTLNRHLLADLYISHGIIQTLIDQPVDDAFSKGFEIKTNQIDEDDIKYLNQQMELDGALFGVTQSLKWGRLYGGAGVVFITGQVPTTPLNINEIDEDSPIEFYAADNWELNKYYYAATPVEQQYKLGSDIPYNFYGNPFHESRVLPFKGKEAPSILRTRFRGWGMSEVERLIRSFNSYLKNNNVIFELLDEAKVDVFKVKGLNTALMSPQGTTKTANYIQTANQLKNFLNALVVDQNDDHEQKQMNFGGLGDMLTQIRQGIAGDLRMPVTKLFGVSSAGFNSGEDDIENYNLMIESLVRTPSKKMLKEIIRVEAKRYLGVDLQDIEIEFPPLRMLSAEQEENVKDRKMSRVTQAFSLGLVDATETKEAINKDNLLPIKISETDEIFDNPSINQGDEGIE